MTKNPLTIQVESYLGSLFVFSTAVIFGTMIYVSAQNMNSEIIIMESQRTTIKTVSPAEKALIDEWTKKNNIKIPQGKNYRYMTIHYPNKPWTD